MQEYWEASGEAVPGTGGAPECGDDGEGDGDCGGESPEIRRPLMLRRGGTGNPRSDHPEQNDGEREDTLYIDRTVHADRRRDQDSGDDYSCEQEPLRDASSHSHRFDGGTVFRATTMSCIPSAMTW
jgi:hypothetical protein